MVWNNNRTTTTYTLSEFALNNDDVVLKTKDHRKKILDILSVNGYIVDSDSVLIILFIFLGFY